MSNLGEYIYMGMGSCNGAKVTISVAYKMDYCVKKALQFQKASEGGVTFKKINKVKVGDLQAEESFNIEFLKTEFSHIFKEYK